MSIQQKTHGAPIQCAKGKCPRAFHVSCARKAASSQSEMVYHVLGELTKEVVLILGDDEATPSSPGKQRTVVSTIKKDNVEVLCAMHNDAAKKDRKKVRDEERRAGLVPGGRVRVRAAAGVFEVSLLRVLHDEGAVEVLWDAGYVTSLLVFYFFN